MGEFTCRWGHYPGDRALLESIDAAAGRLFERIIRVEPASLDISDYCKRYFGDQKRNLRTVLQTQAFVLAWSVAPFDRPVSELTFLDYGGGTGVLSLLARETGLGTVLYNDVYPVSCRDAAVIGHLLGLSADHYIVGDIADMLEYLDANGIGCDAVGGNDVIEHIYDVAGFYRKLAAWSTAPLVTVMASDANPANPRVVRRLMRIQQRMEYDDRVPSWGHKPVDTTESYLRARRKIIQNGSWDLSPDQVDRLAILTRGMKKCDIERCVDDFVRTGSLPIATKHPSNTCDPYTGNWCEHLIDLQWLKNVTQDAGFSTRLIGGFCGSRNRGFRGLIDRAVDVVAATFPSQRLRLVPFYAVCAMKGMNPDST